ncbi:MAG: hypothetical protein KDB11_27130 [Planctomycetales bacterium]|nr:hypothetical protein [Planctomycetales bacterium]
MEPYTTRTPPVAWKRCAAHYIASNVSCDVYAANPNTIGGDMHRRDLVKWCSVGVGGLALLKRGEGSTLAQLIEPRGEKLRITYVKAILTAPADIRLVVVKVPTNQPGLYGLSCATFTQRARVVETAVDKCLRPFPDRHRPDTNRRYLAIVIRQFLLA